MRPREDEGPFRKRRNGPELQRVARVEARVAPFRWRWAEEHADLVAAHWQARAASGADMFNGRVLLVCEVEQTEGCVAARFFETDYASMICWIALGFPGERVWNGFAMGALRCRDGGYLLGRMAPHTANAGQLYFPCGTPDLDDLLPDGTVDLAGSIFREVEEETGLGGGDFALVPGWTVVEDAGYLAFIRDGETGMTADDLRRRVAAHLAGDPRPELAGIAFVSRPDQVDDSAIPAVVATYLRAALASGTPRR